MADQRTTDLDPIATIPDSAIFDVVDTTNTTQDPAGSSFKITKANLLKEATAAILLNSEKVGITTEQAAAILLNTAKVEITSGQADAILENTKKVTKTTISEIRALSGNLPNNDLYTTDLGQEGNWYYDATDTTSSDDTGVVLVTSDGKRIKREFKDNIIQIGWFGSSLNLDAALQTIATSGYTSVKLKNNTTYTLTTQINCTSDLTLLGSGSIINSAVTINFNFTPSSLRFTLDGVFINLDVDTKDRSNAINTFPNYFNGQLYGENNRNSSRAIVDIQNFANQTEGVVNGDPAFILHHYADRKMVQIDNVGAGDIMTLVNARNPIRRKDKASDYVGTGNYLNYRFVSPTDPSFIEQSGFFVDSDFRQVLTGSRTNSNSRAFTTWNNKVDDGFYAFFHRTTNSHANIDHWGGGSNDLGVTKVDAIRFLTDINYSRFKFQNTLTNGIAIEALQGPITLLPNNSNKTVNLYGRIEFPNGFVGSFQVNKSDDAQNAFNFNIVNRHANILNLGNGTVDRFRLKYDSANDRIKQEVVSGAGGFLIEALSGELLLKGTTSVNILGSLKISTAPIDSAGDYNVITRNSSTGIIEKISTAAIISANIVTNTTTAQLSAASLNSTYPSAQLGFQVNCISISSGALVYQKSSTGWYSQSITVVT